MRTTHALRTGTVLAAAAVAALAAGPPAHAEEGTAPIERASDAVLANSTTSWLEGTWGDDTTREDEAASSATGTWAADKDAGSLWTISKELGAQTAWDKKVVGLGVDVALLDTGVTPVPGLDVAGKVVDGPDLSFDSQAAGTRYLDGYGHGTHMAGIIAGVDTSLPSGKDQKPFVGVAPGARIVNVKVGAADGGVDVTQVIAGIDWVVQHRKDNGLNIRVINLSYGTISGQSYLSDPLAKAVENAWKAGIVVVVAAGNDGQANPLNMPAADPYVIAVGASDNSGTVKTDDDFVADFSNSGNLLRRPDLVAPGKSVVSLRVPGSVADLEHPEGLVTGDNTGRYFRGSGSSQAAAVVSGTVALMLQANPSLSPDQVKRALTLTADELKADKSAGAGAGLLDIENAVKTIPSGLLSMQLWPQSHGLGSIELSRGKSHVVDPATGKALTGEVDAMGAPWDGRRWSNSSTLGMSWAGGTWNGRRWSGMSWAGMSWAGTSWESAQWTGMSWAGDEWSGRRWSDQSWNGRRWSGSRWSDDAWSGSRWSGRRWSGSRWSGIQSDVTAPAATPVATDLATVVDSVVAVVGD